MKGVCAAALLLLAVFAGCGGNGETDAATSPQTASTLPRSEPSRARYDARVEAICRVAVRETRGLGRSLSAIGRRLGSQGGLALTTKGLVRPGLRIRKLMAARVRGLGPPPGASPALRAYLQLFDPIDVLIESRLRAGLAGDVGEANRLERLAQQLGEEQRRDAHNAGLDDCAVSFVQEAFSASSSR